MRSVYLAYYPDLAVPGATEAVGSFAELAVRGGVSRIVLLSGRGEPEAERAERAVRDAGARLTILRASWFMQNFSEDYMLEHVRSGVIRLPAGDVPTPFLDADDIADVAVAALTDDRHVGRLYELTGPRALSFAEAAERIAAAAGREVRYEPVSLDEHAAELAAHGVPDEVVELLTYLFAEVMDDRNADTTDDVRRVLGREPRSFDEYVRRAAATGVWTPRGEEHPPITSPASMPRDPDPRKETPTMRKLVVITQMSLDGVMQAPGGPEEDRTSGFDHGGWSVTHWDAAMEDAMGRWMARPFDLLLGRRTYEIFAAHWPFSDDPGAHMLNDARKHVASRTLDRVEWANSTLIEGDVAEAVRALKAEDGPELQVHGSSELIQTLLANDLVDQLRLWIFPVVLGRGKRLFGDGAVPAGLTLVDSSTSSTGVIIATYRPSGRVETGSFALEEPTAPELARRGQLQEGARAAR